MNTPSPVLTVEEKFRKIVALARRPDWASLGDCRDYLRDIAEYADTCAREATPQKPEPQVTYCGELPTTPEGRAALKAVADAALKHFKNTVLPQEVEPSGEREDAKEIERALLLRAKHSIHPEAPQRREILEWLTLVAGERGIDLNDEPSPSGSVEGLRERLLSAEKHWLRLDAVDRKIFGEAAEALKRMEQERDEWRAAVEEITTSWVARWMAREREAKAERDSLSLRVQGLEKALREIKVYVPSDDADLRQVALIARAALGEG